MVLQCAASSEPHGNLEVPVCALLGSETRIYRQKKLKNINEYSMYYVGVKFSNKEKVPYGIPAYTGPFRALALSIGYRRLETKPEAQKQRTLDERIL
jgi:hypothetical protein